MERGNGNDGKRCYEVPVNAARGPYGMILPLDPSEGGT
jgi:hypothetical protein